MNEIKKYAACAFVMNDEKKVLMVSRKDDPNRFGLPGGKLDPGENFLDAACRELFEETGLIAFTADFVYVDRCGAEERGETVYMTATYAMRATGEISTKEAGVVRWLTFEEMIKNKSTCSFSEYNEKLLKHLGMVK